MAPNDPVESAERAAQLAEELNTDNAVRIAAGISPLRCEIAVVPSEQQAWLLRRDLVQHILLGTIPSNPLILVLDLRPAARDAVPGLPAPGESG